MGRINSELGTTYLAEGLETKHVAPSRDETTPPSPAKVETFQAPQSPEARKSLPSSSPSQPAFRGNQEWDENATQHRRKLKEKSKQPESMRAETRETEQKGTTNQGEMLSKDHVLLKGKEQRPIQHQEGTLWKNAKYGDFWAFHFGTKEQGWHLGQVGKDTSSGRDHEGDTFEAAADCIVLLGMIARPKSVAKAKRLGNNQGLRFAPVWLKYPRGNRRRKAIGVTGHLDTPERKPEAGAWRECIEVKRSSLLSQVLLNKDGGLALKSADLMQKEGTYALNAKKSKKLRSVSGTFLAQRPRGRGKGSVRGGHGGRRGGGHGRRA